MTDDPDVATQVSPSTPASAPPCGDRENPVQYEPESRDQGVSLVPLVERAAIEDVPAVVTVLTAAFEDYPWTRWMVPADGYPRRLAGLFEVTTAEIGTPYGDVWIARCAGCGQCDGAVVGAAVALLPGVEVPAEVWERVRPREAELLADRSAAVDEAEAACAVLRPGEPHVTLATTGVEPGHQRRGIAAALLRPVAERASELEAPVYLETSSESNVALYRRMGFEVTGRIEVPAGGPTVWAMTRPPRPWSTPDATTSR